MQLQFFGLCAVRVLCFVFSGSLSLLPVDLLCHQQAQSLLAVSTRFACVPVWPSALQDNMYSVIRHRVTAAYGLSLQTTSFSDLKSSGKTFRPVRRRFFLSSGTIPLKHRQCRTQCHIHARTIWYNSIPRFAVKSLKLPIASATIGAGGFGYANYKFEGLFLLSD
jgi:hypothetical protein